MREHATHGPGLLAAGFPVSGHGEPGGGNIPAYIPEAGAVRFSLDPVARTYRVEALRHE